MKLKEFIEGISRQDHIHFKKGHFQLAETLYVVVKNGKIMISNETYEVEQREVRRAR